VSDYYAPDGTPMELMEWAVAFESTQGRHVGDTVLDMGGREIKVSTVWLGLDHSFGDGPPLIFETMVFGLDEEPQDRYSTYEQARTAHKAIVAGLVAGGGSVIKDAQNLII